MKYQLKNNTFKLTVTSLMCAVMCVLGPVCINIPISPVPVSLTIIGVILSAYVLGPLLGALSVVIYLTIGAMGLPVFSNFSGGVQKLTGPTGGYLIGFIFLSLIAGFFEQKFSNKKLYEFFGTFLGIIVCYILGTLWLKIQTNMTFTAAFAAGVIPYIPFDVIKTVFSVAVGKELKKQLKKISLKNKATNY